MKSCKFAIIYFFCCCFSAVQAASFLRTFTLLQWTWFAWTGPRTRLCI